MLAASLAPGALAKRVIAGLITTPDAWEAPPGLTPKMQAKWTEGLTSGRAESALSAELEALERLGASYITPADDNWPPETPPEGVLRVRGTLPGPGLALVGSRRADPYGLELARRLAQSAVDRHLPVISGGAFGVDEAAHRAALDAGGRTVVVLGSGLSHPTPRAHLPLFERTCEAGAVVSPFPCGQGAARWTFPRRNRWIAALATDVVVVQAAAKSGARYTITAANELGRRAWAVPGPMESPLHTGCHALVVEGLATLLTAVTAWGDAGASGAVEHQAVEHQAVPPFGEALWRAAGWEPKSLAVLAGLAGLPAHEAIGMATRLELGGWLRAHPGGRYARG